MMRATEPDVIETVLRQDLKNPVVTRLPRLLYFGHVPVEATTAGSALLYRLLSGYPKGKLFVIEDEESVSCRSNRLPEARYEVLKHPWKRGWCFLRTRFPHFFWPLYASFASYRANRMARLAKSFCPEAVLTVHEGFDWVTAAKFARQTGAPLHLILHDDWFRTFQKKAVFRDASIKFFSRVYCAAASRFGVSPYMEQAYRNTLGKSATVLYPLRAADAPEKSIPPNRLRQSFCYKDGYYLPNDIQSFRVQWHHV